MAHLFTTLGNKTIDELGFILPHEHIFADFVTDDDANAKSEDVVSVIAPYIQSAKANGLTALVDTTAIGGARRADILRDVSLATGLPIVVATGIFKEPHKRDWVNEYGEDGLIYWLITELMIGIDETDIVAGWIKLSVADDSVREHEKILLKAATQASIETGATIGSHTVSGQVALHELDIIEAAGGTPERFIWVHSQVESDFSFHLEVAKRGAWIEYDNIGVSPDDDTYINLILRMIDAGYTNQLLLSHDRGGYNPQMVNGGEIEPYTYLPNQFLPILCKHGVDEATLIQITHTNPFNAYAR